MKAHKPLLAGVLVGTCFLWAALFVVSNARAEVAGTSGGSPIVASVITDDPDPWGIRFWEHFHSPGGSFVVLNPQGDVNGDGRPSVVWDPISERSMVAWARNDGGDFNVVISTFDGGAAWSDGVTIAGSALDELDPFLAIDPASGEVHLFYWVDDATPRVMHRQAPADLSSWSQPVQVSSPGEPALRPAAAFHGGTLHVAYEVHDYGTGQTPRQVVLSRKEAGGFVPEIVAITNHAGEVRPQVHSHRGRLWLDWVDASNEMAWVRRDTSGQWEPIRYEPFDGVEELEFHVRGAIRKQAAN